MTLFYVSNKALPLHLSVYLSAGTSLRRIFVIRSEEKDYDLEPSLVKMWGIESSTTSTKFKTSGGYFPSSFTYCHDAPAAPFLLGFIPKAVEIFTNRTLTIYVPFVPWYHKKTLSVDYFEGMDLVSIVARAAMMDPKDLLLVATSSNSSKKYSYVLDNPLTEMVYPKVRIVAVKKFGGSVVAEVVFVKTLWGKKKRSLCLLPKVC